MMQWLIRQSEVTYPFLTYVVANTDVFHCSPLRTGCQIDE